MNLLRTCSLGVIGLLVLSSCGLFGPDKPYVQGDDERDPLVLDRNHPEAQPDVERDPRTPIAYLVPGRLARPNQP